MPAGPAAPHPDLGPLPRHQPRHAAAGRRGQHRAGEHLLPGSDVVTVDMILTPLCRSPRIPPPTRHVRAPPTSPTSWGAGRGRGWGRGWADTPPASGCRSSPRRCTGARPRRRRPPTATSSRPTTCRTPRSCAAAARPPRRSRARRPPTCRCRAATS